MVVFKLLCVLTRIHVTPIPDRTRPMSTQTSLPRIITGMTHPPFLVGCEESHVALRRWRVRLRPVFPRHRHGIGIQASLFVTQRRGPVQTVSAPSHATVPDRFRPMHIPCKCLPGAPNDSAALFEAIDLAQSDRQKHLGEMRPTPNISCGTWHLPSLLTPGCPENMDYEFDARVPPTCAQVSYITSVLMTLAFDAPSF